jgi:UDP-N-acetylglucosamine 4,6-dehydratase
MAMTDWSDASVLVTGATGSFGRAFVRTLLTRHAPRRLVVFSRDELKQHEMRTAGFDHPSLRYFIGDVRSADRLRRAMNGVDIVVHAAALKQVPACEYNPFEAIQTNVLGAQNVIEAAIDCGVKRVLALSTDKAVSPANLYGATKLCAEKLFVQGNAYAGRGGTRFACVRYGNVVGSRGSVVPLFLQQRRSGTVTITDPRMTRFWLTIERGVDFVLTSIAMMQGGEVFVPRLPSMRIPDLAAAIAPECAVHITGIRPGEKLHEALVSGDEARAMLAMPDRYIILPQHLNWSYSPPTDAVPVRGDFSYTSDNNDQWLDRDGLLAMLRATETVDPAKLPG